MHTPQYTPNDVKIKPFNGQYSAPDMFFMATDYIMPVMPTANCFVLLAFFIGRLPPEGAGVSYKEIRAKTCIKSDKTVCVTINRLKDTNVLLIDSRNKRDTENIYRLNPEFALTMPQKDAAYWLGRASGESKEANQLGSVFSIEASGESKEANRLGSVISIEASGKSKEALTVESKEPSPYVKSKEGGRPVNSGDSRPSVKSSELTTINTCNTRTCDHDHYSHEQAHDSHEQTHDSHEQAHGSHERDHALMWKEALWHLEGQVMPAVFQGLFTGLCVPTLQGACCSIYE